MCRKEGIEGKKGIHLRVADGGKLRVLAPGGEIGNTQTDAK